LLGAFAEPGQDQAWRTKRHAVVRLALDRNLVGTGPTRAAFDFVTSRAHSMKRSMAGLNIRFFNVMIA
jgi:hypothetical protein